MADKSEFHSPVQAPDNPRVSGNIPRRNVLGGLAGLVGVILAGRNSKVAKAQETSRPLPDYDPSKPQVVKPNVENRVLPKIEIPKGLKASVENAVGLARTFLAGQEVEIKYKSKEGIFGVYAAAESQSGGGIEKPEINIEFPKAESKAKELERLFGLLSAAEIAKLVNLDQVSRDYPEGYIVQGFATDFNTFSGFKIDDYDPQKKPPTVKLPPEMAAQAAASFHELLNYFDFTNYTDGKKHKDVREPIMDLKTQLYTQGLALWLLKSDLLVEKIKNASSDTKIILANVFLSILQRSADSIPVGMPFTDCGVNIKNLDKVIEISGNNKYENYFFEKRNPAAGLPKTA